MPWTQYLPQAGADNRFDFIYRTLEVPCQSHPREACNDIAPTNEVFFSLCEPHYLVSGALASPGSVAVLRFDGRRSHSASACFKSLSLDWPWKTLSSSRMISKSSGRARIRIFLFG
jgi:hypothetical protein